MRLTNCPCRNSIASCLGRGLKGNRGRLPSLFSRYFFGGLLGQRVMFQSRVAVGVCGDKPRSARLKQRVGLDRRRTQRGRNCHLSQVYQKNNWKPAEARLSFRFSQSHRAWTSPEISSEQAIRSKRWPHMGSAHGDVARSRHRAVIACRLRDWYNAQLVKCSEDAEIMLQHVEEMGLPSDGAALRYSFPIPGFRSGRD